MFRNLIFLFTGLIQIQSSAFAQKNERGIEHHYLMDLSTTENPGCWINMDTRKQDSLQPGNFYSLTDINRPYGLGFESGIPDDLKKKNSYMEIRAKLRVTDTNQHILLVTEIRYRDSSVIWKGVNVAKMFGKAAAWVTIHDSLLIPSNLPPESKIKTYIWNQDGKAEVDFDDLDIRFTIPRIPTYLVY